MTEYYVRAHSFAAPFFSDTDDGFIEADTPEAALTVFVKGYKHPAGLYAAVAYLDANAYHKGERPLAKWLCNHEIEKARITADLKGYSYTGHGVGEFDISGIRYHVENPKEGRLVPVSEVK